MSADPVIDLLLTFEQRQLIHDTLSAMAEALPDPWQNLPAALARKDMITYQTSPTNVAGKILELGRCLNDQHPKRPSYLEHKDLGPTPSKLSIYQLRILRDVITFALLRSKGREILEKIEEIMKIDSLASDALLRIYGKTQQPFFPYP